MIEKEGKEIVKPQYLKAGDKVALISPAYWVPEEVILKAAEVIRSWGLEPVIGAHTTNQLLVHLPFLNRHPKSDLWCALL